MLNIFLILLVTAVSLTVLLWIGTFFFQGYIYLEPSQQLYWQAPAAALALTIGYGIWCIWIAMSPQASPQNVPIDTVMRFTPKENLFKEPAPKMIALKKPQTKAAADRNELDPVVYVRTPEVHNGQKTYVYRDTTLVRRPWHGTDLVAIEIEMPDGTRMRFDPVAIGEGDNVQYQSKDGWVMKEYAGIPTGLPERFNAGRFILNIAFNVGHYLGWFVVLWLVLRFQWGHAVGLAIIAWLVATLAVLPMMLTYSAYIASVRYGGATTVWLEGVGAALMGA